MYNYYSTKTSPGETNRRWAFFSLSLFLLAWMALSMGHQEKRGDWIGSAFFLFSPLSMMVTSFFFPFCIYILGLSSIHYYVFGMMRGCMDWAGLDVGMKEWDERRCERLYLVSLVLGCMIGVDWEKDGLWLCFFFE
jgi:hypothetical protein